jgi:hypothetical protein
MTVCLPSGTIRFRGVEGFTIPTFFRSRITASSAGYPLMDTTRGPLRPVDPFVVSGSEENGAKVAAGAEVFRVFLLVISTQPAATIHPISTSRAMCMMCFIGFHVLLDPKVVQNYI